MGKSKAKKDSRNQRIKENQAKASTVGSADRSGTFDAVWAVMIGLFLAALPMVFSAVGYESFDAPKTAFLWISVPLLALAGIARGRRLRLSSPLNTLDLLVVAALVYIFFHSLLLGRIPAAWPGLVSSFVLVLFYFILRSVPFQKFHQYVWIGIAASVGLNAVFTILQQLDKFPLMLGSGRVDAAGRLVPAGFIGEVNRGGFMFALVLIILLYFIFGTRNRGKALTGTAILLALLVLAGLAFSRTLTAILGLSACLLVWLVFHNRHLLKRSDSSAKQLLVFWLIVLFIASGAVVLGLQSGAVERLQRLEDFRDRETWIYASSGRTPVFYLTWEMIKENPWIGNGLNSFPVDFFEFKTETELGREVKLMPQPGAFKEVHNEYLQTWLELGLPGLLLLLLLFVLPLYYGFRAIRAEKEWGERTYWIGVLMLALVLIGITCLAFFPLHLAVTTPYICLVVAGLSGFAVSGEKERGEDSPGLIGKLGGKRSFLYGLAGLVAFVSAGTIYAGIATWQANRQVGMASYILTKTMSEPLNPRQKSLIVKEALHILDQAEEKPASMPEIHKLKGTAYLLLGRFDESTKSFKEAARLNPGPEAYVNLATAGLARGDREGAVAALRKAQAYDMENNKARQLMEHMWREGLFDRGESLDLIRALEKENLIDQAGKKEMLAELEKRGLITGEEYQSLITGRENEGPEPDSSRK